MLAAITFVCVGAISVWRLPLPWPEDATFTLPPLYQMGIAAAVLVGLGFTSVYAWRVAAEEERLNIALAAAQAVLAREQTLSALGGLAAAAAHELGTPLATIHLVAKEMARGVPADDPRYEDLQLLVTQSERCRSILGQLSARREQGDVILARKDTPTSYHLSVVVDDALQGITDVVRGQDLFHATSVHRVLQALRDPSPATLGAAALFVGVPLTAAWVINRRLRRMRPAE